MISLGSRDARKGLGLGLGFGAGAEMEETDLEEGEACFYRNDDYSTIDPDIALSYIDEKLQDVLGHFQKDFEGGVSAENLGAKFGGYGSFLPTYQRSPVWSHPRTPQKVNKSNMPRSPNKIHTEGGRHNSKVLSNASLSVRHGQASAPASSLPSLRTSVINSANGDIGVSFPPCAEESSSGSEPGEKNAHPSDQKTLKVRIKVGSDNLSTQKNADIYSGLGLDNSPASSFDDIRTNSERFSREHQDGPDESPTSILQIMTSFPVHGNILLSPLPDDLFNFTEKEKHRGESKPRFLQKGGQESSNGSDAARVDDKLVEVKKWKPLEKHVHSVELNNFNDKETQNDIGIQSKNEKDIETLDCEELVASALKLPLLSNSYSKVVNSANGTASVVGNSTVANKGKEEFFSDLVKHETMAVSAPEIGLVEKHSGKAASAGKVWEDKKVNSNCDNLKKDSNVRVEKADVLTKVDTNVSKARKSQNADPVDLLEKASKKTTSVEEDDMQLASGKEQSSSGERKKSKGSQSHSAQGAEVPKDGSRMDSSFVPKNRKSTHGNYYLYKREVEDSKLERDNGKARNTYKDFFGDTELELEDNDADSAEMLSIGRSKDLEAVEKRTIASNTPSKKTLNGKKTEKPFTSEPHSKASLNAGPSARNGSITDAAPGTLGPLVKEDWVCCDKCQKWRLLPLGTNPDSLPEKWLCSMLNWLPGMNRCSVSEEETTKALIAPYQVPAPENHNKQHGYPGGVLPGLSLADGSHFDQNHQNLGFHPVPSGGKKKNGTKDVPTVLGQVGPAQFSNSTKKNLQATVKSRSLNGVNQSRPAREIAPIHLSKSSGVEKHRHKQKEKNKLLEQHSDEGETRSSKIKSKRDNDQDHFRVSKKIKIDGMHCTVEDWMSDRNGLVGKVGPSSSSGLSGRASGKDQHKYDDPSSKDGKCEVNSSSKGPHRNPKDQCQVTSGDGCPHVEKIDDKAVRKRKMNESQDTHVYTASLLSGHHPYDRGDFTEQKTEDIHRKKARVSKSEGKEAIVSKGSGGAANKGTSTKEQQLGPDLRSSQSHRSLDATDSLRRDVQSVRRSQAATSSSSKVSGSHKSKINKQEAKGSPVESVSSSPLRFSYPDKSTLTRKSHEGKDYFGDAGFYAAGTPRRCSDGEDDRGSYRSGTFQERDIGHLADSGANIQNVHSPELANCHFANGGTDTVGNGSQCPSQPQALDQCHEEERKSDKQCHANVSRPRKPGKGSSSRSKDKNGSSKSEVDKGKAKISDSCNEFIDRAPYEESSRAEKHGVQEKLAVNSDEVEKNFGDKKESSGKVANANSKRESRSDALSSQDQNQDMWLDSGERSSTRYLSERTDRAEVCGRGKSHPLPPSGRGQNERVAHSPHLNQGSQKENGESSSLIVECGDALKAPKQIRQSETHNGNQPIRSRHPTINGQRVRDVDAPSPVRRDSSNQATNAVKEAKDLKHLADRLKNSGSTAESTGLYFQAALKFLHGASLLQSTNGESAAKQGEMIQSMQIYSSTAKLCEFCAHEYEKSKDMAAASLAYKCMEVAYMRVIYSSHTSASRDRNELQSALLIVPPGESPSSSASDVDNVNNPPPFEKAPLAKGVSSPQVAGNQFIAARNRPSFVRLLNFAQDVNYAMEASRKSRMAFTAANQRKEAAQYREGMTSVKTALDFNFQDVEGLLHLVRLAMEAIGR